MYHNIAPAPRSKRLSSLYVHPHSFAWQMRLLSLLGYKGLAIHDLVPYLRGEKEGKVVGISFDDGYLDNYTEALPVLQKFGFTASCYLVSGLLGRSNLWAVGQDVQESPLMSTPQVRSWLDAGMSIGSHTHSHAHLCRIEPTLAAREIEESKAFLETSFQCPISDFCYPYGEFDAETIRLVRDAGYSTAVTTQRLRAKVGDDLHTLPRVHVTRRVTPPLFLAKLLTGYEDKHREAHA